MQKNRIHSFRLSNKHIRSELMLHLTLRCLLHGNIIAFRKLGKAHLYTKEYPYLFQLTYGFPISKQLIQLIAPFIKTKLCFDKKFISNSSGNPLIAVKY